MAGLEGIDASTMDLIDALGAVRFAYDVKDRIVRPVLKHADRVPVAVVREGERVIEAARFGLPTGRRLITNARSERLTEARTWSALLGRPEHHCLTAISYVVERDAARTATYRIQRRDGGLMVVPGLCAVRHYSFTSTGNEYDDLGHVQVTAPANAFIAQVHDRFVCELTSREACDAWMAPQDHDVEELLALLTPAPEDRYELVPVANDIWTRKSDPGAAAPTGQPVTVETGLPGGRQSTLF